VPIWTYMVVMGLVAVVFVAWPLYTTQKRVSATLVVSIVAIVALSAGLYVKQGSPDIPHGGVTGTVPPMEDMVVALAARLEREPNDLQGWQMLGRSYMSMRNFSGAVSAYQRAVQIEASQNAATLVELGEALLARDNSRIEGETAALFESALAIEPNNPTALFYGGIAALNRDEKVLAAERWEILLGLNPPAEIEQLLRQRIAEWRGEPPPAFADTPAPPPDRPGAIVTAQISLSAAAAQSLPTDATVFVIARDPAQPSPPIAVSRIRLSEMPAIVELGDGNSMVPGRELSGFAKFELVARVSISGQPGQQPGDWFGAQIVIPAESPTIVLSIDQQVP
jgi:cytochrome c-type biogenesis protein CcmH